MVALSGRTWKLAPCLVSMVDEANRIAPKRIRTADGSIGDAAHSARTSQHNPEHGYVCAVDLTHAPASGFDAHARARMTIARRDPRIRYVISNGQIARGYATGRIQAWTWEPYTGPNAHRLHAHWSVWNTPELRSDRSLWWPHSATPTTPPPPVKPPESTDMHGTRIIAAYGEAGYLLATLHPDKLRQHWADIDAWTAVIYAKPEHERAGGVAYVRALLGLA